MSVKLESRRMRSVSAPALRVSCGSYSRLRSRETDVGYEHGKDRLAHWIGAWSFEEVCGVLESLVTRCPLNQLEYLWTSFGSVPHRDFQLSAQWHHPESSELFQPLSTPTSREVRARLNRSRRKENKCLYRVHSAVLYETPNTNVQSEPQLTWRFVTQPDATSPSRLPGLRPSTSHSAHPTLTRTHTTPSPSTRPHSSWHPRSRQRQHSTGRVPSPPSSRLPSPMRRHMQTPPTTKELLSALEAEPFTFPPPRAFSSLRTQSAIAVLPPEALQFLSWFSSLTKAWQQQELLQLVVWNLDRRELYYLATLLLTRQYRDFIGQLPDRLVCRIMAYIPPKDILRKCCRVSHTWNTKCSSEALWRIKCFQNRMGLSLCNVLSWKQLFIDDLRLKRNWRRGRFVTEAIQGHRDRVLCVRIRDNVVATSGADNTIRVWNLETWNTLATLKGHLKSAWCLCFYGKNLLISGSNDCTVKVWNFKTGTCERTLVGHEGNVWALQQKNEVLITGSHDNTVCDPLPLV